MATPYVFLSHTAKDKPFARYLDAALASHGVATFLDERDIRVGESIPRRVYESIDRATHLICILSPNSVNSRWVQDELDASTMRTRSGLLQLLPVLIEDCPLPGSLQHVKYADFREWQEPRRFTAALGQLLSGLGVSLKAPATGEVQFFLAHHEELAEAETLIGRLGGVADGAMSADQARGPDGDYVRIALKWEWKGNHELWAAFNQLSEVLDAAPAINDPGSPLPPILNVLNDFYEAFDKASSHVDEDFAQAEKLRDVAYRLSAMLAKYRAECLAVILAIFVPPRP